MKTSRPTNTRKMPLPAYDFKNMRYFIMLLHSSSAAKITKAKGIKYSERK